MDFKEAHDTLNRMAYRDVAAQMEDWHPAILGEMLRAVQEAKLRRYPGYHPDYYNPLAQAYQNETAIKGKGR